MTSPEPSRAPRAPRTEIQIVTLFRSRAHIQCPEVAIVGIPNAGRRGQWAARQAQREGMQAGFPDIMCLWPGRGVAFIEFKKEKGGRVSPNQAEWLARLPQMGFPAIVASDPDQAIEFLRWCGAPFMVRAA